VKRCPRGLPATVLLLAGGLACGTGEQPVPLPSALHPVIILDIDTLRADHLGCYGYRRPTSPNIDALAADSVLFEWAFSQAPNTPPSQASIFTSLYPTSHGLVHGGSSRISERAETLAEHFQAAGARTAAFVDGGYMAAHFGFDRGFESYDNNRGGGLARIGPKVADWLREHRDESFLLLVHTYDVHSPYSPNEPYRSLFTGGIQPSPGFEPTSEKLEAVRASQWSEPQVTLSTEDLAYTIARYDGGIRMVDDWIGELLSLLRELALLERATIVLLSDHGEEFQEHGSVLHEKLFATVNRVPLLIRLPEGYPSRRVSETVATIDLMPTLLELIGRPVPSALQGQSLLPFLRNERGIRRRPVFSESPYFGRERAVARGDLRLIWRPDYGSSELYRYRDDPLEQRDVAGQDPVAAQRLLAAVRSWDAWVKAQRLPPAGARPIDPETEEQLRALGYLR
jgi:arylsulfatase A-like enzyme